MFDTLNENIKELLMQPHARRSKEEDGGYDEAGLGYISKLYCNDCKSYVYFDDGYFNSMQRDHLTENQAMIRAATCKCRWPRWIKDTSSSTNIIAQVIDYGTEQQIREMKKLV